MASLGQVCGTCAASLGQAWYHGRNLSSAARAYHEENKEDHARTRGAVEKAAKDQKLVGSCSGEVSSRSQAAAQKRKRLRSGASKAKGKSKGKANVGSVRSKNCKNSSSSPTTPDRAPPPIALEQARPFAAKEAAEATEAKRLL